MLRAGKCALVGYHEGNWASPEVGQHLGRLVSGVRGNLEALGESGGGGGPVLPSPWLSSHPFS